MAALRIVGFVVSLFFLFPMESLGKTRKKSEKNEEDKQKTLESIKSESQREYMKKRIKDKELYTIQDMMNKYDSSIKNIDDEIKKIYDFLKERNLWKDTIFLVLGDHGDNLTEHEIYFSHAGLYEDSIHIPLLMHIPGFENKEINGLTQIIDIVPSIK